MKLNDLMEQKLFPQRLRLGMAIADIRSCELADRCGMNERKVYNIRNNCRNTTPDDRSLMLRALEDWKPGTLEAIRAVERELRMAAPPLREHNRACQMALS